MRPTPKLGQSGFAEGYARLTDIIEIASKLTLTIIRASCKRAYTGTKGSTVKAINSGKEYYFWFYYKTGLPELR